MIQMSGPFAAAVVILCHVLSLTPYHVLARSISWRSPPAFLSVSPISTFKRTKLDGNTMDMGALYDAANFPTPLRRQVYDNDDDAAVPNNQNKRVITSDSPIVTPSSYLDQNLTNDERSIVNIVRSRSPSVACVSCYSVPTSRGAAVTTMRKSKNSNKPPKEPPMGSVSLGSGSAFAISSDGYLLTNYHVIQRAYQIQQANHRLEELQNNITQAIETTFPFLPTPLTSSFRPLGSTPRRSAQVYVSLKSSSEINIPCRIVHVAPERDIAVLHMNATFLQDSQIPYPPPIPSGLSTDLLVGQTVLAIGNPFGLSQTVTTGVVSSLDRTVRGVAGNDIRGCIQTDAAINPGNSGGPLLNSMGQVVGVNTMIVSTSGSNAGIGFAVPLDGFWTEVMDLLEEDRWREREKNGSSGRVMGGEKGSGSGRKRGWLGFKVLTDVKLQEALFQRMEVDLVENKSRQESNNKGVFVLEVESGSPAREAGIQCLRIQEGTVEIGDRIVAVNGNGIGEPNDLKKEIRYRTVGEKITLTLENGLGERRVVYLTMAEKRDRKSVV